MKTQWVKNAGVRCERVHFLMWSDSGERQQTWQRNQCRWWYQLMLMCSVFVHITPTFSQRRKMSTGCLRSIKTDGNEQKKKKKLFCRLLCANTTKQNSSSHHIGTHNDRCWFLGGKKAKFVIRTLPEDSLIARQPEACTLFGHNMVLRKFTSWHLRVDLSVLHHESPPSFPRSSSSDHPNRLMSDFCRNAFAFSVKQRECKLAHVRMQIQNVMQNAP